MHAGSDKSPKHYSCIRYQCCLFIYTHLSICVLFALTFVTRWCVRCYHIQRVSYGSNIFCDGSQYIFLRLTRDKFVSRLIYGRVEYTYANIRTLVNIRTLENSLVNVGVRIAYVVAVLPSLKEGQIIFAEISLCMICSASYDLFQTSIYK